MCDSTFLWGIFQKLIKMKEVNQWIRDLQNCNFQKKFSDSHGIILRVIRMCNFQGPDFIWHIGHLEFVEDPVASAILTRILCIKGIPEVLVDVKFFFWGVGGGLCFGSKIIWKSGFFEPQNHGFEPRAIFHHQTDPKTLKSGSFWMSKVCWLLERCNLWAHFLVYKFVRKDGWYHSWFVKIQLGQS